MSDYYFDKLVEAQKALQYTPIEYGYSKEDQVWAKEQREKLKDILESLINKYPIPNTYTVYGLDKNFSEFDNVESLIKYMKEKGFEYLGKETNTHLLSGLQGQPTFKGLIGPMYDGPKRIRYETQERYDALSR